ncbi:hypothetical protein DEJ30_06760 [Curtobacterium sp. MCPF17_003]|nr:hypothetical protein DEJ30_06760 [Curtobacterium sp. MCPF17_003]PZE68660.1 hypothetical protein DEJ27_10205 [Curtobacterium sp. MCPF17_018]PZF31249.1 hypothetical protein DEJ35_07260 [Curtobacterium sp. MCPF17_051]
MTSVSDHVERRWGSVDAYLRAFGLQDDEIARL